MWFVINVQIYAVLRAFHLDLPFTSSFVVTAAAVLGLMFPTPGGLGSYHVAVQLALTDVYGVARNAASGVAVARARVLVRAHHDHRDRALRPRPDVPSKGRGSRRSEPQRP